MANFPPATDVLWAHRLTLREAGGSPRDFPFDVIVGGEVMHVDATTDATPQTMTVTLSVNGIVKAHPAGSQVRLARPSIVAL